MSDLSQRLKDATPEPPDLGGLAHRSAVAGRRRRDRARAVGVAAVALVVLGAGLTLPRLLGDGGPEPARRSEPQCVAAPDAPVGAIATQEATWVRFCEPEAGATRQARHPRTVATGALAAAVVQGWAEWVPGRTCRPESRPAASRLFRLQVGLADGRVTEIAGDTACVDDHLLFMQAETPLLLALPTRRTEVVEPAPVTCPEAFTTTDTNRDGLRADLLRADDGQDVSTVPLLPGSALAVDVCAYTGTGEQRTLVDSWRSMDVSDLRGTATTGYADGQADCDPRPDTTSYVVVMQDDTGTARAFSVDTTACNAMSAAIGSPAVETYLGLATPELVAAIRRSARDPLVSPDQQ